MTAAPGQTVGPFFHLGLEYPGMNELVPPAHPRAVRLHGRVTDGAGEPVPDAMIEIWQADPQGHVVRQPGSLRRDGWTFTGWGRAATDPDGRYRFATVEPGRTTPERPAFFAVTVFARGLLDRLFTRAYLPDDPAALAADPLLAAVDPARRDTLIARRDEQGLIFDVRLQGAGETVFVTYPRLRDAWA
ncbi:protocatechuate 4,5-dioxygenase subunit alpha [Actinoplanes sp. SE50]|uniref:protocatechuate 3,4-dioxygenase subunit alpha n=1 Tax=unclassified Actinoplanes TaxID=2626549 RepID=UPI00023ECE51|nr:MULTISPECIES: protocatechuate 3,4-dioxygenase subunit alpha [unclassified Actinoplanes]AEV83263.1 protocatechuate 3,4-dioxygenase, alpha subunit [Actinoplanes sp. SE50/110]ATO81656.1 protocatechuate 4,5-dioxygenase subunit alpha [Actinoplanes sp. SE50]SLL99064.1 protocatechuate 3,4-dioxygenase subunit alpha [Actinoplanes sp. SE50/110]